MRHIWTVSGFKSFYCIGALHGRAFLPPSRDVLLTGPSLTLCLGRETQGLAKAVSASTFQETSRCTRWDGGGLSAMITMTQECFSSPWRGGSPIISLLRSQRPNPTFLEDGTTSTTTHSLIFLGRIITLKTTRLLARAAGWHSSQVLLCLEQPQEGFCPERHSSQQKGASDSEAMLPGSSQWGLVCARFSGSPWGQMAVSSEITCGDAALASKAQVRCGCLPLNLASPDDVEGLPSERQGVSVLFQGAQLTMEAPHPFTPCPPPVPQSFPTTFLTQTADPDLNKEGAPQPPELGTLGLSKGNSGLADHQQFPEMKRERQSG